MAFEHPVEHEAGEEPLRRVMDDREVLGSQVLAPAEPVCRARQAVVVECARQQLAAAHVEDERDPRLGEASRSMWAGEKSPGASDGSQTAATPSSIASSSAFTASPGSARGRNPTAFKRGSGSQNAAMARLRARVPP